MNVKQESATTCFYIRPTHAVSSRLCRFIHEWVMLRWRVKCCIVFAATIG